jgi:hypothetical protein
LRRKLTFKATGAGRPSSTEYAGEPRETESVRTFAIVNANLGALMAVNRAITVGADDLRPVVVTIPSSRTIAVRATPDVMARIARVIADNDKQSGGSLYAPDERCPGHDNEVAIQRTDRARWRPGERC